MRRSLKINWLISSDHPKSIHQLSMTCFPVIHLNK